MSLQLVQSTIKELEAEKFSIHNIVNRVLKIAHQRKDLKEIIYLKLNKVSIDDEKIVALYEEYKPLATIMRVSLKQYREIFIDVESTYKKHRMVDWHVSDTKGVVEDHIVGLSISELTNSIFQLELLLEKNQLPEGLHTLDLYYENLKKRKIDNIYINQLGNCRLILNNIRDYLIDYLINLESDMVRIEEIEVMNAQEELTALIENGHRVKHECYTPAEFGGGFITGIEYNSWIEECKMFLKKYVSDTEILSSFSKASERAVGNGESHFNQMTAILNSLKKYDLDAVVTQKDEVKSEKIDKIFISHSSKDIEYVSALVDILNDIGIKKSDEYIFCSSLPGYGIPYGEDIYDFLKQELKKENIMVLFVLSDNYYDSAPCLNEMGATWITSKQYNSVLTPNFNFKMIDGAINPTKISFRMNDKDGVNNFRDTLIKTFELDKVDYKIWEKDRNVFLEKVNILAEAEMKNFNTQVQLENVRKVEEDVELQFRFVNITEREIEFRYIDIELIDKLGNKFHTSIDDSILDEFRLHPKENKVIKWRVKNDTPYLARRDDREKSIVTFEI
ncbi:toll/interleukin-1 receptor domain-containing protein [Planococcus shenhongbingii]|uniref:toll/interleukin-1 receptor domain-containing protein n=1 Tax=Planococcus shenhongbingii TaxID=3058398 RepID=UPI00262A5C61|nr:toll/interleukin-1 receptor domain-containing protein [Planococcus sp. N016]WKA60287.1 toll/interleukin-1 receptor domain-containing protein [Planococcus sp. N016]